MANILSFDKQTLKTIAGSALYLQAVPESGGDAPAVSPVRLIGTVAASAASGAVVTAMASGIGSAVSTMIASGPGGAAAGASASAAKSAAFGAAASALVSGYITFKG